MRTSTTLGLAVSIAAALAAAACGGQKEGGATADPESKSTAGVSTAPVTTTAPTATPTASPSPTPSATVAAAPSGSADAPAASGSAAAGAKTFDCGAKGQKLCPMQGWMKSTMAAASSSGDGEKLASALGYVAAHVPPGFSGWAAMASAGAAKAKAGDIDGAKLSCKQCHDAYKEKYKTTMRDRPY